MLLDTLLAVRSRSEGLIEPLEPEDLMLQGMADASPPKWHLGHTTWFFRQGDTLITEHSVKYSQDAAAALAAHAGWRIERRWTDPHQQMALHLLLPAN